MFYFFSGSNRKKIHRPHYIELKKKINSVINSSDYKMASTSKTPPFLSKCKTDEDWLKLIKIWRCFTELPAKRQGSALVLSLEDEALDAVLEIDEADIAGENGVDAITTRLNRLFQKDSTITKYQSFESFITFKRQSTMLI